MLEVRREEVVEGKGSGLMLAMFPDQQAMTSFVGFSELALCMCLMVSVAWIAGFSDHTWEQEREPYRALCLMTHGPQLKCLSGKEALMYRDNIMQSLELSVQANPHLIALVPGAGSTYSIHVAPFCIWCKAQLDFGCHCKYFSDVIKEAEEG